MARPKAECPPPEQLRALIGSDGRLAVRVTPGARREAMTILDGKVQAKVRARAQDGAANAAVEELVAKALGVPTSRCRIVRGATSREKLLKIAC